MAVVTGPNLPSILGPKVENWRGKIDKNFYETLLNEGIKYDSGKVWITFKTDKFKGKNVYVRGYGKISRGRIIITTNRLIAIISGHKLVNVPLDHPWFKEIIFETDKDRLNIIIDLEKTSEYEGIIKLGYHINPEDVKDYLPI
jgi:hypothetical protein